MLKRKIKRDTDISTKHIVLHSVYNLDLLHVKRTIG
jgi:hypothetical protein